MAGVPGLLLSAIVAEGLLEGGLSTRLPFDLVPTAVGGVAALLLLILLLPPVGVPFAMALFRTGVDSTTMSSSSTAFGPPSAASSPPILLPGPRIHLNPSGMFPVCQYRTARLTPRSLVKRRTLRAYD